MTKAPDVAEPVIGRAFARPVGSSGYSLNPVWQQLIDHASMRLICDALADQIRMESPRNYAAIIHAENEPKVKSQ